MRNKERRANEEDRTNKEDREPDTLKRRTLTFTRRRLAQQPATIVGQGADTGKHRAEIRVGAAYVNARYPANSAQWLGTAVFRLLIRSRFFVVPMQAWVGIAAALVVGALIGGVAGSRLSRKHHVDSPPTWREQRAGPSGRDTCTSTRCSG